VAPKLGVFHLFIHSFIPLAYAECNDSLPSRAERARGSDGPDHKGLSDRVGGTLEHGCNTPRRMTLQNQTKGRRHSGSCGESKSYKGVNPDQKS